MLLAIANASIALAGIDPEDFRAIPGEREHSGRLIAKAVAGGGAWAWNGARPFGAGATVVGGISGTDMLLLEVDIGPGGDLAAEEFRAAQELLASGGFEFVHPDWTVFAVGAPNDPRFAEQWHHATMESEAAWDMHLGLPEIAVGVVDTGIAIHADLPNRLPGYNSIENRAEIEGGTLTDEHGHGTHVAGCAAAVGDNGVGVVGMGWNLKFIPVRAASANGTASLSDLLEGAVWAAQQGAVSVSVSFSGIGTNSHEETGNTLRSLGSSLLWSAGNSATNLSGWDLPSVLVIGASDSADAAASFSSYGRGLDLFAPGVSILAPTRDGAYAAWNGTSMAAPLASGALAMIRSINPALTPAQAEHVLQFSCDAWGGERNGVKYGFGRVNLRAALERAVSAHLPGFPVGHPERVRGLVGTPIDIDVLANDDNPDASPLRIVSCSSASPEDTIEIRPGAGMGGRDIVRITSAATAPPGVRTFTYVMQDPDSGFAGSAECTVELLTPKPSVDPGKTVPGLDAQFFVVRGMSQLPDFSVMTPFLSKPVAKIMASDSGGNFHGSGRADEVGAVYTGYLIVPYSGIWDFTLESDDGSRLWIDGQLIVNNDGLHPVQARSGSAALDAGAHPIRIEYFENFGAASIVLKWSSGSSETVVPATALRRNAVEDSDFAVSWGSDAFDQSTLMGAFQMIDARWRVSIGLRADGSVECVGITSYGQTAVPTDLGPARLVAAGDHHMVAVRLDGTVRAWGSNSYGQTNVPAISEQVVDIQAGWYHSIALDAAGTVIAWGRDNSGQCQIPSDVGVVARVDAGDFSSGVLRMDGSVRCWGGPTPGVADVPATLPPVAIFSIGWTHALARLPNGTVRAWGTNSFGESSVPLDLVNVVEVSASGSHSLALLQDGTVRAWGLNTSGQCAVPADAGLIRAVAAGGDHSVGVRVSARTCPADMDGDGHVDHGDIALVMLDFGPCPGCMGDIDGTGIVDFADAAMVVLDFGPCVP